jgi:predicted NBD/HSP70 family sugar kinase
VAQELELGGAFAVDLGDQLALAHHEDAGTQPGQLVELRRDDDDSETGRGQIGDHLVELGLGGNVNAAGRLVEQQDATVAQQPPGEHNLLLVSARELAHHPIGVVGDGVQHSELLADRLTLGPWVEHAAAHEPPEIGQAHVFALAPVEQETLRLAVLRGQPQPRRDRAVGSARGHAFAGPERVLDWADERFHALLRESGRRDADVHGIGIGVPGPVEHATGRPRNPPIMPGWDGYPIPERFADRYGVPVLVDNDVNIMARGEQWTAWREVSHLLFVKVATGIGCGVIVDGRIHRGADGAAGDIGHIRVVTSEDTDEVICSCGNVDCLEALASGGAMARQLRDKGLDATDSRAVVELARAGEAHAVRLVRDSGRLIGEVLAASVNLYNPSVIVIGGDVAQAHEQLLAGIREVVYQRSLPLATRHLRIVRSQLEDRAGVIGAAVMVIERVLSPAAIDAAIAAVPPGEQAFAAG